MPKRRYFTVTAAKEAQRAQTRDWQHDHHLADERRTVTPRKRVDPPRAPSAFPAARSVQPPPRGSVALTLFYGWRH